MNIHRELREGFRLVGESSPSGIFPVEQRPAPISVQELFQQAKYLRPTLWGSISNAESSEISQALWDITLEESLEKGWLEPPRSKEELDARFPQGWIPVRRFGIVERNKLRPIDDLSERLHGFGQAHAQEHGRARVGMLDLDKVHQGQGRCWPPAVVRFGFERPSA